jgi:23S rRNA (cytosine1962-C5)-methyltransferase
VFCRGRSVLNLFGYTGGFSIAAGAAGAAAVTTVDVAGGALADAEANWALNSLPPARHEVAQADCFDFLDQAAAGRKAWEVVVVDPPSFAPNKASVAAATASYEKLFAKAAAVTER